MIDKRLIIYPTGVSFSSLGDDTAGQDIMAEGRDLDYLEMVMPKYYYTVTGWDVEAKKSLACAFTFEFLREQGHGGYVANYKSFNKLSEYKIVNYVCICKPASHVGKTMMVEESKSRISKLLDEVAAISKLYNLNLHPGLGEYIDTLLEYNIPQFKFFTEPIDYVPIWNTRGWVKAGKPAVPNKFSVKIKGLESAFSMAGKEAAWYTEHVLKNSQSAEDTLNEALGISWTKSNMEDYDHISSLKASRLYRYLVAKYRHDNRLCQKILQEVHENPGAHSFYESVNGGSEELETSAEVIDDFVLLTSKPI